MLKNTIYNRFSMFFFHLLIICNVQCMSLADLDVDILKVIVGMFLYQNNRESVCEIAALRYVNKALYTKLDKKILEEVLRNIFPLADYFTRTKSMQGAFIEMLRLVPEGKITVKDPCIENFLHAG